MENFLFDILFFIVLAANIASFWLKFDLKKHGYKTNLFWGQIRDLINAREVMKTSDNLNVRKKYRIVLNLIAVAIISIGLFAMSMFATREERDNEIADQIFQNYLNRQFEGIVLAKYIDSSKYKTKRVTLELDSIKENYGVSNFIYKSAEIGDYVVKNQGDSTTLLVLESDTLKFVKRREEFNF